MIITVEHEDEYTDYTIDIHRFPFLQTLLPSDFVGVVRPTTTNEVSFRWIDKGYVIPMSEFNKMEIEERS
jgi:hypothetical protein